MDLTPKNLKLPKSPRPPKPTPVTLRQVLQKELVDRCKKNPRYSLRAFARQLGVSASVLSRVMAGSREPSKRFVVNAASCLRLDPKILNALQSSKDPSRIRREEFRDLMADQFEVLSDWVHYAIFELMETNDFHSDVKWMSVRLGLSVFETQMALDRLESLKLIEKFKGRYKKLVPDIATTAHEFSTVALRQVQRQFLEMAAKAMDEVPMERRSQTTMVMAIDPSRVVEAKERIRKFRYEMIEFLQETKELKEVYNLTIGFYPVTK